LLKAHLRALLRHPLRYLATLFFALRMAGVDPGKMAFGLFYFVEAVVVGEWMRAAGLRHLHVHFATPASTVGLIASRLGGCGLSITVHGPDEFYDVSRYQLAAKIQGAAFLCAIGNFARSQLMKLSPVEQWDKFEVTPLGVDPAAFTRQHRDHDAPFEILCVGRLVPAKGQHVLLAAVRELADRGREVALRFVGDGPDRRSLEDNARALGLQSLVHFEGSVNQDRIRDFYNRADAFVLPSFAEGIPVVLMEAMAMQVPCITTRITGIPELIRDGVDGLLVVPSDEQELADAIERLIVDPKLRCTLGCAGRKRVMERYDLDTNTRRLAEVFRRRLGVAPC
jgi:glycosyltransferase involved in cell wall biosynthesis